MSKHYIVLEGNNIEYSLIRKKVSHINLSIRTNGKLVVSAHLYTPLEDIRNFLFSKSDWILNNLLQLQQKQVQGWYPENFTTGETLTLLDKEYQLIVQQSKEENIYTAANFIHIDVKNIENTTRKSRMFSAWLKNYTMQKFDALLLDLVPLMKKHDILTPQLKIRKMSSRWGSCQPTNKVIILNSALIHTPPSCVQYVMIHELVHLRYRYHKEPFYDLLSTMLPTWREQRRLLNTEYINILY